MLTGPSRFISLGSIQILVVLSAITLLSACGGASVTIESPLDGALLDTEFTDINISYSEGDSNDLLVQLNGVDITNSLSLSNSTAIGTSPELAAGLNVLKVTTKDKVVISRFDYYLSGIPQNATPLFTHKAYDDAIVGRYNFQAHNRLLNIAEQRGISTNISVPTEVVSGDARAIVAQLHDQETPGPDKTYMLDTRSSTKDGGFIDTSTLHIYSGECMLEIATETHSQTYNLCENPKPSPLSTLPSLHTEKTLTEDSECLKKVAGKEENSPCESETLEYGKTIVGGLGDCKTFFSLDCASTVLDIANALLDLAICDVSNLGGDGSTIGDPHIKTLDGVLFDNQLVGEFILVREKSQNGLEIQTRQQDPYGSCASWNYGAAMRLDGDIVEYQPQNELVLVNGAPTTIKDGEALSLPGGTTVTRDDNTYTAITLDGHRVKVVLPYYMNVYATINSSLAGKLEGLLGNFDGDIDNDMTLRNGDSSWDISEFNENWRLQQSESLFTYKEGEDTNTYTETSHCELVPDTTHKDLAFSIYYSMCGVPPLSNEPLIDSIATDLAAGVPEEEVYLWSKDFCSEGKILTSVSPWTDITADFSGSWDTNVWGTHLTQTGKSITGTISGLPYLVRGTVNGNVFNGEIYDENIFTPDGDNNVRYIITLTMSADRKSFTGVWQTNSEPPHYSEGEYNGTMM